MILYAEVISAVLGNAMPSDWADGRRIRDYFRLCRNITDPLHETMPFLFSATPIIAIHASVAFDSLIDAMGASAKLKICKYRCGDCRKYKGMNRSGMLTDNPEQSFLRKRNEFFQFLGTLDGGNYF